MGYTAIDMTGMIVGRLTVIERAGSDKRNKLCFVANVNVGTKLL